MTTKEFINRARRNGYTVFIDNGYIRVYNSTWFHLLSVNVNEMYDIKSLAAIVNELDLTLLENATEYARTPIKDRVANYSKSEKFYIRTNTGNDGYLNKSENGYFISTIPLEKFTKEELDEIDRDPFINLAKYSYFVEKAE